MGHISGPCAPHYEDYEDLNRDYQNKSKAADHAFQDAAVLTGISLTTCAAVGWTGVGTPACLTTAAAALAADARSVRASLARDDAYDIQDTAFDEFMNCVNNHKNYYKPQS